MKKILFLLAFLFLIIPTKVLALDVAKIGDTPYESLTDAITNASDSGDTITLLTNWGENITIPEGKEIILDLNGYTLSNNGNKATVIEDRGKLTITNGTVTSNASSGMINVYKNASLTINDGYLTATYSRQAVYNNGGLVTIGGTAELTSNTSERATVHNLNNGTINILGGKIIANNSYAIYNEKGTINIGAIDDEFNQTSPLIQGKTYGIIASTPYKFYDGIIKGGTGIGGIVTKTGNAPTYTADPSLTKLESMEEDSTKVFDSEDISGVNYNTFTGYIDPSIRSIITFNTNGGESLSPSYKKVYTGDSIGTLPTPYRIDHTFDGWYTEATGGTKITESMVPTGNQTIYAHWTYVDPNTEASVDGVLMSLKDALLIGGNIKLERDVVASTSLVMNKEINLDLNGHTLALQNNKMGIYEKVTIDDSSSGKTGKITSNLDFTIVVGASSTPSNGYLIHKGGTIEGLGAYGAIRNYETTIIDGGTVEAYATNRGYTIYNNKNLIMESGTVYSSNGRAVEVYANATFTMNGGLLKSDGINNQTLNLYGNCSVTINGGTIEGLNDQMAGIAMFGNTNLEVNGGTIIASGMAVAGNGNETSGNTNITINGGDLIATNGVGMYLPQRNSNTVINGGNISGPTGIEIRASDLTINGGNITATNDTYEVVKNSNGTTTKGAALAVMQHNTMQPINVYINGGNLKGLVPVSEGNPMGNPDEAIDKVAIYIKNGNFISTGDKVIDVENLNTINQLVTGGTYTYDPTNYVQDGYGVVKLADNLYEVTKIHNVTIDSESIDFITVNSDKYPYKTTVNLNVVEKDGFIAVIEIRDTNGNLINVNNNKFMMPDSDVTIKVTYKKDIPVPINPKTYDGIMNSIVLFIASIIGLLEVIICVKKRLN